MLRTIFVGVYEGQVYIRLVNGRKLALRFFRRFADSLHRHPVARQIDAVLRLEVADDPILDDAIEIVAAEQRIAARRFDLKHAVGELEDRDIEGAAAEIVHGHLAGFLLVEAVREGRGRRLVHDAQYLESGDPAGVLRRLPLRVVEIRRHRDDGLHDILAEILLGRELERPQNHGRYLGRLIAAILELYENFVALALADRVRDAIDFVPGLRKAASHETLDRVDGIVGIGDGLALGELTDEPFVVLRDRDNGGSRSSPFRVRNDGRFVALDHGDARVRRSQIDADYFCHGTDPFRLRYSPRTLTTSFFSRPSRARDAASRRTADTLFARPARRTLPRRPRRRSHRRLRGTADRTSLPTPPSPSRRPS